MSDIQLTTIHRLEDASARGSPYLSHHTIEDNGNSSAGSSFSEDSGTPRRTGEAIQEGNSTETETQGRLQRWLVKIRSSNAAVLFAVSIALLTDMLVYGVVFPILPDYAISELGASPSEVGILFASYAFGLLGATPVFGVVSDKVGRKTPMLISLFGLIAATIVFGISRRYLDLFVARIAQGFSAAGSWVVGLALVADVFPVSQHGTAMGVVSSVNSLGLLVGPPFGGFLYDRFGYSVPFVICAIIAVIDLVLQYLIIPSDEEVRRRKEKSVYDQIRDGASPASPASPPTDATPVVPSSNSETKPLTLWTLLSYHEVLLALWLTVLYSSAFSGIEPVLPIHLYNLFRASPTVVGLLYFAIVIAYLLTSVFVGKVCDRVGAQPLMFMGALGLAVVSPLIALPQSMFLEIIALLLFGTAVAVIATPVMVHLSLFVDSHGGGAYAQIYALYLIAYSLGMMLGPLGAGFIMDNVDFTWTCIFFSLLILTYFPVLFLPEIMECCRNMKRRLRGTPAEEAPQTSPIEVVDSSSSNP